MHTIRHFTNDIKGNYSYNFFRVDIESEQAELALKRSMSSHINSRKIVDTPNNWMVYSRKMPRQFQCRQYLNVVDLLATRFAAVGILDSPVSVGNYWRVLSNRTGRLVVYIYIYIFII